MSGLNHHYHHHNLERKCKIRKRGCSSSSSSSLVRKYRFKRAILVGKRGGSSTPVPSWETTARSLSGTMQSTELKQNSTSMVDNSKGKEVSVSARKLGATLWGINQVPSKKKDMEPKQVRRGGERSAKVPSRSASLPHHLSDPSYTPFSERLQRKERFGGGSHHRKMSTTSNKLQLTDCFVGGLDSLSTASFMELEENSRGKKCILGVTSRLKEVNNGLTTSKELLKILNHVFCLEEQRSLSISLVSALRVELDRACIQIGNLIREQQSNRNDIEHLLKHFAEEKAAWKRKERERILDAISCIAEELGVEKKLRRQTERLNKKLGKELADTKAVLSKKTKEVEREKRAKEILEQICEELARSIGEDRAQVEELKRESAKVRVEVEKEREMLQLADVLREERVHMKLSEAKYHFEEKNAAVEQMRNELEAYLRSKIGEDCDGSPKFEKIKELEAYLKKINFGSSQRPERRDVVELAHREEHEGDDSGESDLHSIELNMDNNDMSYKWSYACGNDEDDSKRISVDKEFAGRKSLSEKIQWGSICLNKSSNNIDLDFDAETSDLVSQAQAQGHEDEEVKRYRSAKDLAEQILSGTEIVSLPSFTSPTQQWSFALPLKDHD
ncbi:uncharacterized protein LOC107409453 [Ziziphus jujuba]|uniref:Uncharacterized protein LOC107409453 n=1 Tax=Ziziphus jujuba TaxID=326968 RepID=A0A6P3Z685_ZIZJJ|nr:uncharacterized protein LOC107409453 [Ziziphus jujuba]